MNWNSVTAKESRGWYKVKVASAYRSCANELVSRNTEDGDRWVERMCGGGGIIWYDEEVVWGIGKSDDVVWIVLKSALLVVCRIMREDSDDTLEPEEWLEGNRRGVYHLRLFVIGPFLFLLSLFILLNSKVTDDFGQLWLLSFHVFSKRTSTSWFCFWYYIIVPNITYA